MRIALITRALTRNQGNVALSQVWKRLVSESFPESQIVVLERIPLALKRYTRAYFAASIDPISAFDAVARQLAAQALACPNDYSGDVIALDRDTAARNPSRLRESLDLRRRLAQLGVYNSRFERRQGALASCDVMVMNAAGEFLAKLTDTPIQYMLDMRVAQLLGLKTAFVNTSFEIEDRITLDIALHVLDRTDVIAFRDTASEAHYRRSGGRRDVGILADAAMLYAPTRTPARPTGRVAISLSARLSDGRTTIDDWRLLALALRRRGLEPVFVSNEWQTDEPHFSPWLASEGFTAQGKGLDVDDYIAMLAEFDALISARLHSCVLALIAGCPVIPVELGTSKISGYFDRIGLAVGPLNLTDGWIEATADRARSLADAKSGIANQQQAIFSIAQTRLRHSIAPIIAALGDRPLTLSRA